MWLSVSDQDRQDMRNESALQFDPRDAILKNEKLRQMANVLTESASCWNYELKYQELPAMSALQKTTTDQVNKKGSQASFVAPAHGADDLNFHSDGLH